MRRSMTAWLVSLVWIAGLTCTPRPGALPDSELPEVTPDREVVETPNVEKDVQDGLTRSPGSLSPFGKMRLSRHVLARAVSAPAAQHPVAPHKTLAAGVLQPKPTVAAVEAPSGLAPVASSCLIHASAAECVLPTCDLADFVYGITELPTAVHDTLYLRLSTACTAAQAGSYASAIATLDLALADLDSFLANEDIDAETHDGASGAVAGAKAALSRLPTLSAPVDGTWAGPLPAFGGASILVQLHQRADGTVMGYLLGGTRMLTVAGGWVQGDQMALALRKGAAESSPLVITGTVVPGQAPAPDTFVWNADSQTTVTWQRTSGAVEERRYQFFADEGPGWLEVALAFDGTGTLLAGAFTSTDCSLVACDGLVTGFTTQQDGSLLFSLDALDGRTGSLVMTFLSDDPDDPMWALGQAEWSLGEEGQTPVTGTVMGGPTTGTTSAHAASLLANLGQLADDLVSHEDFSPYAQGQAYASLASGYVHFGADKADLLTALDAEADAHPDLVVELSGFRTLATVTPARVFPLLAVPPSVTFHDKRYDGLAGSASPYRDIDTVPPFDEMRFLAIGGTPNSVALAGNGIPSAGVALPFATSNLQSINFVTGFVSPYGLHGSWGGTGTTGISFRFPYSSTDPTSTPAIPLTSPLAANLIMVESDQGACTQTAPARATLSTPAYRLSYGGLVNCPWTDGPGAQVAVDDPMGTMHLEGQGQQSYAFELGVELWMGLPACPFWTLPAATRVALLERFRQAAYPEQLTEPFLCNPGADEAASYPMSLTWVRRGSTTAIAGDPARIRFIRSAENLNTTPYGYEFRDAEGGTFESGQVASITPLPGTATDGLRQMVLQPSGQGASRTLTYRIVPTSGTSAALELVDPVSKAMDTYDASTGPLPACDDSDRCTDDLSPALGQCEHLDNRLPCVTAQQQAGQCTDGECVATTPPPSCDDNDPCTDDARDPGTGSCTHTPNTASCWVEGSSGQCVNGTCVAWHQPGYCDDGNVCTDDSETAPGTCSHLPNQATCSIAGSAGQCSAGQCVPTTGSCDDGNPCTNDWRDEDSGTCMHSGNSGVACDDGVPCTVNDACTGAGTCTGTMRDCDDLIACTMDWCDPATGQCAHSPINLDCDDAEPCTFDHCEVGVGCVRDANIGLTCNDNDACTTSDACTAAGTCAGSPVSCDDGAACTTDSCDRALGCLHVPDDEACLDDNPCTTDTCLPWQGCIHMAATGQACDDNDACTTGDACTGSRTCEGTAISCDDGVACTTDTCDPGTGCVHTPVSDFCDDDNPCTTDTCNLGTGCSNVAKGSGVECSDGSACTTGDACDGAGNCVGTALDCDDADPCTADYCNPLVGCQHFPATGEPCDDGNACTVQDACDGSGVCGGQTRYCNDGVGCTIDACDPATGCVAEPSNALCADGNPCSQDLCDAVEGCLHPAATGEPCDDGSACTTGDACTEDKTCVGTAISCDDGIDCTTDWCDPSQGCRHQAWDSGCNDNNPCTTDTCDLEAGCTHPVNLGQACDDQDACTGPDACDAAGACVGPTVDCNDGVDCTLDSCLSGSGCRHEARDAFCDDGNLCTDEQCDAELDCVRTPVEEGAWCDDDDACTYPDACNGAGLCVGVPLSCYDGNPCTLDSCDPQTGIIHLADVGTPCDDGYLCTKDDACTAEGFCHGAPDDCDDEVACTYDYCSASTGCVHVPQDGSCDDSDPCTVDSCDRTAGCQEAQAPTGTPCNDDSDCTVTDACDANGQCHGVEVECEDGDACTADSCNEETGVILHVLVVGASCDDADPCTSQDTCKEDGSCSGVLDPGHACSDGSPCTAGDACNAGGVCVGTPISCDDGNECTQDECDESVGCTHGPRTPGWWCNDGNACTSLDHCDGQGGCAGTLDWGYPGYFLNGFCVTWSCDPAIGWTSHDEPGHACDDGDNCTLGDQCTSELVCEGTPLDCDDHVNCTEDSCSQVYGCVNRPIEGACDDGLWCTLDTCDPILDCVNDPGPRFGLTCADGDLCTINDTCQVDGACAGTAYDCTVGLECVSSYCDPVDGSCSDWVAKDGFACDDDSACTAGDTCLGMNCYGDAIDCADQDPCTVDSCSSTTGCAHTAVPDGGACDDGNACTEQDVCQSGACAGSTIDCDDSNPCTVDSCDTASGCTHAPSPGTECDDGNACTEGDVCSYSAFCEGAWVTCSETGCLPPGCQAGAFGWGVCTSHARSCDDMIDCTTDSCDPASGCNHQAIHALCDDDNPCTTDECHADGCSHLAVADATPCDDSSVCTSDDQCLDGWCQGDRLDCDDGNSCTVDSCNGEIGCLHQTQPNNSPCSDGTACTEGDLCQAGTCVAGATVSCDDGVSCSVDSCDPHFGCMHSFEDSLCDPPSNQCQYADCRFDGCLAFNHYQGMVCGEGNWCVPESCDGNGNCVGEPRDCNDYNECTIDSCDPVGLQCLHVPRTGELCDDESACTTGDLCIIDYDNWPRCRGTQIECDDGNPCSADGCIPERGCSNVPYPDRSACGPSDSPCSVKECRAGVCVSSPMDCDDGNPCTDDSCDPQSPEPCAHIPRAGDVCDDEDVCTSEDACDSLGQCHGLRVDCGEGDGPCLMHNCYPTLGCVDEPLPLGAVCDDGDACTTGEVCDFIGSCSGGDSTICPSRPCGTAVCDPFAGCSFLPSWNGSGCDDGDACTSEDHCWDGICSAETHCVSAGSCLGKPTDCNDNDPCTVDSCSSILGCLNSPLSCSDGDDLTLDFCDSSMCQHVFPWVQGRPLTSVFLQAYSQLSDSLSLDFIEPGIDNMVRLLGSSSLVFNIFLDLDSQSVASMYLALSESMESASPSSDSLDYLEEFFSEMIVRLRSQNQQMKSASTSFVADTVLVWATNEAVFRLTYGIGAPCLLYRSLTATLGTMPWNSDGSIAWENGLSVLSDGDILGALCPNSDGGLAGAGTGPGYTPSSCSSGPTNPFAPSAGWSLPDPLTAKATRFMCSMYGVGTDSTSMLKTCLSNPGYFAAESGTSVDPFTKAEGNRTFDEAKQKMDEDMKKNGGVNTDNSDGVAADAKSSPLDGDPAHVKQMCGGAAGCVKPSPWNIDASGNQVMTRFVGKDPLGTFTSATYAHETGEMYVYLLLQRDGKTQSDLPWNPGYERVSGDKSPDSYIKPAQEPINRRKFGPTMDCATVDCVSACIASMQFSHFLDCAASGFFQSAADRMFYQRIVCTITGCTITDPGPLDDSFMPYGHAPPGSICHGDPSGPDTSCFFGNTTCGGGVPTLRSLWWTDPAPYPSDMAGGRMSVIGADRFMARIGEYGDLFFPELP